MRTLTRIKSIKNILQHLIKIVRQIMTDNLMHVCFNYGNMSGQTRQFLMPPILHLRLTIKCHQTMIVQEMAWLNISAKGVRRLPGLLVNSKKVQNFEQNRCQFYKLI